MSQGVPTGLEGQIDSPNSFELLWDRYRRWVIGAVIAVVAAIGVKYLIEYFDRKATDSKWSAIAASTGLNKVYSSVGKMPSFYQDRWQLYFSSLQGQSVSALPAALEELDRGKLDSALADAKGDDELEPILLWFSGLKAVAERDYDTAESRLQSLKSGYPKHFLAQTSDAPPQWRPEVKDEDEDEKKPKPRRRKIDFEEPVAGSPVDRLLKAMNEDKAFRAAQTRLYTAVEPSSDKVATITLEDPAGNFSGTVKIRFFDKQAPKHVEAFIKAAQDESFFDNMRIHRIERPRADMPPGVDPMLLPSQLEFGLEVTKEEDDRTKWVETGDKVDETHVVDWEGADELSHYPGTLAAKPATDSKGKSQIERLVINGADVATRQDGSRVIFGRVIEGLDLIQRIIDEVEFPTESENESGAGAPSDDVRIKSIVIE